MAQVLISGRQAVFQESRAVSNWRPSPQLGEYAQAWYRSSRRRYLKCQLWQSLRAGPPFALVFHRTHQTHWANLRLDALTHKYRRYLTAFEYADAAHQHQAHS